MPLSQPHELSSVDRLMPPIPTGPMVYLYPSTSSIGDAEWNAFCSRAEVALKTVTDRSFPHFNWPIAHDDKEGMFIDVGAEKGKLPPKVVFRDALDHPGPPTASFGSTEYPVAPEGSISGGCEVEGWPRWSPPECALAGAQDRDELLAAGASRSFYAVLVRLSRGHALLTYAHHTVMDGHSMAVFVNAWAAETAGAVSAATSSASAGEGGDDDGDSGAPRIHENVSFDNTAARGRADRFDPENAHSLSKTAIHIPIPVDPQVTKASFAASLPPTKLVTLAYTRTAIEEMRSEAGAKFSSNDLIVADCMRLVAEACKGQPDMPSKISFPANLRSRSREIGLPANLIGNAVGFCDTDSLQTAWAASASRGEVAEFVRNGKIKCTTRSHFESIIDWEAQREARPRGMYFLDDPTQVKPVIVTNWSHFDFFAANFGLGRPSIVFPFTEINFPNIGIIIKAGDGSDTVLCHLALPVF